MSDLHRHGVKMMENFIFYDGSYSMRFSLPMVLACTWDVTNILPTQFIDREIFGTLVDRSVLMPRALLYLISCRNSSTICFNMSELKILHGRSSLSAPRKCPMLEKVYLRGTQSPFVVNLDLPPT